MSFLTRTGSILSRASKISRQQEEKIYQVISRKAFPADLDASEYETLFYRYAYDALPRSITSPREQNQQANKSDTESVLSSVNIEEEDDKLLTNNLMRPKTVEVTARRTSPYLFTSDKNVAALRAEAIHSDKRRLSPPSIHDNNLLNESAFPLSCLDQAQYVFEPYYPNIDKPHSVEQFTKNSMERTQLVKEEAYENLSRPQTKWWRSIACEELEWVYPPLQQNSEGIENENMNYSSVNVMAPCTPMVQSRTGSPVSKAIAPIQQEGVNPAFMHLSMVESFGGMLRRRISQIEFDFDDRHSEDNDKDNRNDSLQDELGDFVADVSDLGPYYKLGDIVRLQRRFDTQNNKHIQNLLNLNHTMSGNQIATLAEYLMRQQCIEKLTLVNNGLTDEDVELLSKSLQQRKCQLKYVDLSDNKLTHVSVEYLVPFLTSSKKQHHRRVSILENLPPKETDQGTDNHAVLQALILSGNKIEDKGVKAICEEMASYSKVQKLRLLDISNCGLTKRSAVHLSKMLSCNGSLKLLNLGWNYFGLQGAREFAVGLEQNGSLRYLKLEYMGLGDVGGSFISKALQVNPQLKECDLTGNNLGIGTCSVLSEALAHNDVLNTIVMNQNPLTGAGIRKLLKIVHKGHIQHVSIQGCSFAPMDTPANEFNPKNPNGKYVLNLALPIERQVAIELYRLAEEQGMDCWYKTMLNNQQFTLAKMQNWPDEIPTSGTLKFEFHQKSRPKEEDIPLTDDQFKFIWLEHAQDVIGEDKKKQGNTMTDEWKLQLLATICADCYFTCAQAKQILSNIMFAENKVDAGVKVFGRIVDLENFQVACEDLQQWQVDKINQRIGILALFHPLNPTNRYDLMLSHQAHYVIAARLLEMFRQQHNDGLCNYPFSTCWTYVELDGEPLNVSNPNEIVLPKKGRLQVNFTDLRPIPENGNLISPGNFTVLLGKLANESHLDGFELVKLLDNADIGMQVGVIKRFANYGRRMSVYVSVVRRESNGIRFEVKDTINFVSAMRLVAIRHYVTYDQLRELINLIPFNDHQSRVELVTMFWARLVDRKQRLSDILRLLENETQIKICQRLGYYNVFDPVRPAMHYHLRMFRADEHQVAYRLARMALSNQSQGNNFINMKVDGTPRKMNQGTGLFAQMRGNAPEGVTPTVTLDFDFAWPDNLITHWAAITIQSAWRRYVAALSASSGVGALTAIRFGARLLQQKSKRQSEKAKSTGDGWKNIS